MTPRGKYILVQLGTEIKKEESALISVAKPMDKHRGTVLAKGDLVGADIAIGDEVLFEDYGRIMAPEDDSIAFIKDDAIIAKY